MLDMSFLGVLLTPACAVLLFRFSSLGVQGEMGESFGGGDIDDRDVWIFVGDSNDVLIVGIHAFDWTLL